MTFASVVIAAALALNVMGSDAPAPAPAPDAGAPQPAPTPAPLPSPIPAPAPPQPALPIPEPAPPVSGAPTLKVLNFDADTAGKLPGGWKVEGTRQYGPLATWQIVADKSAPSPPNVLALTRTNHTSDEIGNICWTDKIRFKEGTVEVKFKAVSGKIERGGGLIWRVKDKDNYLLARMNPAEDNLRLYYVRDGMRRELDTRTIKIDGAAWHTLKIEQKGERSICSVDGTQLIDLRDGHSSKWGSVGGIGLWTKADAVTSFDDLKIELVDPVAAGISPGPELPPPDEKRLQQEP